MSRSARGGASRRALLCLVGVLAASGLGACGAAAGSSGSSAAARVESWMSASDPTFASSLTALQNDDRTIRSFVHDQRGADALHSACAVLEVDAGQAAANLPSPDPPLTTSLQGAYDQYLAAAQDCFAGAAGSTALLARSATERVRGAAGLARAVTVIAALTGRVPVTSTTTPQGGITGI